MTRTNTFSLAALAAVIVLLIVAPLGLDPFGYTLRILCLMLLFCAMGQAWNIVGGLANQISLGHAAYFGIGAYSSTILFGSFGISPILGAVVGMVLAALFALVLSVPTLRLKGHYFALATLAAGEVARVVANSWSSVTGGPVGISVPYRPDAGIWALQFQTVLPNYYLFLGAVLLVSLVFWLVQTSAFGFRLRAIKENETAAEVIGVDTYRVKLYASLLSAVLTAALGTLYAQFQFFFDPDTIFGVATISVKMALIVILGGAGRLFGPWVGAFVIIPLEEMANSYLGNSIAGLSQFAYGVLLIVVILLNPRGLISLFESLRDRFIGRQRT
ncbi:MAG: branched-chain amino acid ABC transporter permease [Stappia sp.]|uniref:branched-chain amino acid ABC transporter permease n=1 Tax=Stappia sp. TaxID=1870903 RepID=UPI000C5FE626|nr:branched-chain amino acid ABC transporter permease [Stappia sp.]MBM18834.1 branched-chain amino acid ABC transporter permease [Stappia sp.]